MNQTPINTALQTVATIAAQTLATTDPKVAAAIELAQVVAQFLDSAAKLQQVGVLSPEQFTAMFGDIGKGIQSTHDQWAAMNAAPAK